MTPQQWHLLRSAAIAPEFFFLHVGVDEGTEVRSRIQVERVCQDELLLRDAVCHSNGLLLSLHIDEGRACAIAERFRRHVSCPD